MRNFIYIVYAIFCFLQGPGYFLDENTGFQFVSNSANLSYSTSPITFSPGSEGSSMYGMHPYSVNISAASITIANNYITGGMNILDGAANSFINANYMGGGFRLLAPRQPF